MVSVHFALHAAEDGLQGQKILFKCYDTFNAPITAQWTSSIALKVSGI